jgi:hemoglobin/transferrin/lactoferrin receptor protein
VAAGCVSYAEAFRAPSLTDLYVSGQHFPRNAFVPNPTLQPATSRNI